MAPGTPKSEWGQQAVEDISHLQDSLQRIEDALAAARRQSETDARQIEQRIVQTTDSQLKIGTTEIKAQVETSIADFKIGFSTEAAAVKTELVSVKGWTKWALAIAVLLLGSGFGTAAFFNSQLNAVTVNLTELKTGAATTRETLDRHEKRFDRIDSQLTELTKTTSNIQSQIAKLDDAAKRLTEFSKGIEEKRLVDLSQRMEKAVAKLEQPVAKTNDLTLKIVLPQPEMARGDRDLEFTVALPRAIEPNRIRGVTVRVIGVLPREAGIVETSANVDGKFVRLLLASASPESTSALLKYLTVDKKTLPVDVTVSLSQP